MHVHAIDDFLHWQRRLGIVVELCAGDDMDVTSCAGQVKSEVGEDLASCRMIRTEKSIDENKSRHRRSALQEEWPRRVYQAFTPRSWIINGRTASSFNRSSK